MTDISIPRTRLPKARVNVELSRGFEVSIPNPKEVGWTLDPSENTIQRTQQICSFRGKIIIILQQTIISQHCCTVLAVQCCVVAVCAWSNQSAIAHRALPDRAAVAFLGWCCEITFPTLYLLQSSMASSAVAQTTLAASGFQHASSILLPSLVKNDGSTISPVRIAHVSARRRNHLRSDLLPGSISALRFSSTTFPVHRSTSSRFVTVTSVLARDDVVATGDDSGSQAQQSRTESFLLAVEEGEKRVKELEGKVNAKQSALEQLQSDIDKLYSETFAGVEIAAEAPGAGEQEGKEGEKEQQPAAAAAAADVPPRVFESMNEEAWGNLGRSEPSVLKALIESVDRPAWTAFQREVHSLALRRDRTRQELRALVEQLDEARTAAAAPMEETSSGSDSEAEGPAAVIPGLGAKGERKVASMVLVAGFESFNVALYKQAAAQLRSQCPGIRLSVFSNRDILSKSNEMEAALARADVFFGSLIVDYDECEWLQQRIKSIPIRLIFESSLELMAMTTLGSFAMAGGKSQGMPAPVKAVLSKFGAGREEDRMVGYLSFLKVGPKLLRFIPGKRARDLRNWLTVYGYWNQGGLVNVVNMFLYLANDYLLPTGITASAPVETPPLGLYHPDYDGYFTSPSAYLRWFRSTQSSLPPSAPVVALLLYRKHVVTQQPYIPRLIRMMQQAGLVPLPIFINGVEAHTVVRDLLTTAYEQEERRKGVIMTSSLAQDAVVVDAVVSTIGFPLVGGPAGSMEGGRQAEVAKSILLAKNVPYVVAAPLLIQDIPSWKRDGVQGLQSVVLYSLPELDGAIDAIPLGGLVGDGIHLVPERVRRLTSRLWSWINLRRTARAQRKVALVLYGFPPGVGATGTAALLNVPKSLEALLQRMHAEGYDLGPAGEAISRGEINGEDLIALLQELDADRVVSAGEKGPELALKAVNEKLQRSEDGPRSIPEGVVPVAECIDWRQLRDWIGETLTGRMERAWGELRKIRSIHCDSEGRSVVSGIQLGNVWIGVQPVLGLEGDPMRLLFERDLTPHPQYAAFYKWLQQGMQANAVVHFGMHGTVEWLPGSPLGNTGLSWSDVLLGNLPNIYIYAANNPSESIVAKRRGYGTIVSYNVPPYGRAGLYKELAGLRELISEFREDPAKNESLKPAIVGALVTAGMQADCPFVPSDGSSGGEAVFLDEESLEGVSEAEFEKYLVKLYEYLAVVENRLFSEGLHNLGRPPKEEQMEQYLSAYFGDDLDDTAIEAVAHTHGDLAEVRQRLEQLYLRDGVAPPVRDAEVDARVAEAVSIRQLLARNTEELDNVLRGLDGDYVPPAVGGDLLRDGPGVLPTGRNIHALDPYRMPSAAAWERGSAIAANIIQQHLDQHGTYPETIAVMLWGLDAIKTRGESVAIALALVGAHPVKEGTGRVVRFDLTPLEQLGRPRIDVLANLSGIFRDSFANVVELLDDLFRRAGEADEPPEMNFIRKHSLALQAEGIDASTARIFSNPAGDYGSMVNERIGAADWENGEELGDTWQSRNSFSYGRGEQGVARPEVMRKLLQTTDRIVQEIDSVEYGLTDIQEYYANTGAMKNAAETARNGAKVSCSVVETYGKDLRPRDLEATLRLEYRSKLLNPKWAEKMAAQGSGGAYEISQRMTALLGWGGTTGFQEDWVFDQAADTYALDDAMAAKLRKNNPQEEQPPGACLSVWMCVRACAAAGVGRHHGVPGGLGLPEHSEAHAGGSGAQAFIFLALQFVPLALFRACTHHGTAGIPEHSEAHAGSSRVQAFIFLTLQFVPLWCVPLPLSHTPTMALQAFQNILKRMLEAAGRGMWQANDEVIEKLRELYAEMDDELEGVKLR
ncbi:unnamed protein product [Closterium sp. NIES-54]